MPAAEVSPCSMTGTLLSIQLYCHLIIVAEYYFDHDLN